MMGRARRLPWAGGESEFCLAIGELRALEQRRDAGIGTIQKRMYAGDFYVDDIVETLRLGLQGGGMTEREAQRLIEAAYRSANYITLAVEAANILTLFVAWPIGEAADDPDLGETGAAMTSPPSHSPTAEPAGPVTSDSGQ